MSAVPASDRSFHVNPALSFPPSAMDGNVTPVPGKVRFARAGGVAGSAPIQADIILPELSKESPPAVGAPAAATAPVIRLNFWVSVVATPAISLFGMVMSKCH